VFKRILVKYIKKSVAMFTDINLALKHLKQRSDSSFYDDARAMLEKGIGVTDDPYLFNLFRGFY
jgi:hypothetical protein